LLEGQRGHVPAAFFHHSEDPVKTFPHRSLKRRAIVTLGLLGVLHGCALNAHDSPPIAGELDGQSAALACGDQPRDASLQPGPTAAPQCASSAFTLQTDLRYAPGAGAAHLLDLYLPASGQAPYPTVIWVHGGGWRSGSKEQVQQARRLVCAGFALASINYRLSGEALFPAQIHDVKAAIRYLRANAAAFGLDGGRFAVFGSSAGGHLAALAATSAGVSELEDLSMGNAGVSSRVQAAVDWFGPTDLAKMDSQLAVDGCPATHARATSAESELLGCTLGDASCAAHAQVTNPIAYVDPTDPPFLVAHGTKDCVVPEAGSAMLHDALTSAGVCSHLREVVGAGHGDASWSAPEVQNDVARFLTSMLQETPEPEPEPEPAVNCSALDIQGDPRSSSGAKWTYESTDEGESYRLEGLLFAPAQSGSHPGLLLSHGRGGSPKTYASVLAPKLVAWGLVVIAPMYTHADVDTAANLPDGSFGASEANVLRAHKASQLLSCLDYADFSRVGAHGHSMGGYLTGQLLGTHPDDFVVASHTAGGTRPAGSGGAGTDPIVAANIRTPYQLHHGKLDNSLPMSQRLDQILTAEGVAHELHEHPNVDHNGMAMNRDMLELVKQWYVTHGLLEGAASP
jgi:acetyl esterase/lipase